MLVGSGVLVKICVVWFSGRFMLWVLLVVICVLIVRLLLLCGRLVEYKV